MKKSGSRRAAVVGGMVITATIVLGVAAFLSWNSISLAEQPHQETLSLKGVCEFHGTKSTWSATLTRKGDNLYDAVYTSSFGGKPLAFKGTIKSDLKTTISGNGVSTNKNGNGTFEFSGKFGDDGVAKCLYKEVGGRRNGSLTVELPK
jgi:hypothetical protein